MIEYMEFDTCPLEEKGKSVGESNYYDKIRIEAKAMINQLHRTYPQLRELGMKIKLVSCPHDFGEYHEIRIYWRNESEADIVFGIESTFPEHWDNEAKVELQSNGY